MFNFNSRSRIEQWSVVYQTATDYDSDESSVTLGDESERAVSLSLVQEVLQDPSGSTNPTLPNEEREVIDLTSEGFAPGDYLTDEAYDQLLRELNRAEPQTPPLRSRHITRPEKRRLPEACLNGIVYKKGQSVQLHDGTFLRIEEVVADRSADIFFRGRRLIHTKNHSGKYIPRWDNELVWIANEAIDIPSHQVRNFVRITFTNFCMIQKDWIKQHQRPKELFCRLKEHYGDKKPSSVEYLTWDEADEGFKFDPPKLRRAWRGETKPFGAFDPGEVVDLDDDMSRQTRRDPVRAIKRRRQYTFGDAFCGAGGVTCGARAALLHPEWACDKSESAVMTYKRNYPDANVRLMDLFTFIQSKHSTQVDIVHGSPPCQTFSPAHTIESVTDDANNACIFSCLNLLQKSKPRILTMEETSGLFERHRETFNRVILDFIELGYAVRWGILNCVEYGVPQLRRRLVIIASGPGESLPQLPKPTHGPPGSGRHPYVTIRQAISDIRPGAPHHNTRRAAARPMNRTPCDGRGQVRTITCGGGEMNAHPSGRRNFTNREYACLQTFPRRYHFCAPHVRKQIGNAVPPKLAQAVYEEIVRSLHRTDEKESRHGPW
ncbi:C-5 cytosine methyltransferase DmtA [Aspergillus japonicus CBS 114.51]|uniref:Cytosine-specific methyltransferase n=1 Tax=Aspergillus japonicus CBS 114.51 TaxID=1448312 RepID=A0A8T8WKL9_ASPJA|nr:C-5 cytosine methyltransferase DmtA [Aspergillus japonicus CBS 114.51]RAH76385.1 C-5 cytosine methyltransferase DmtA [Aspergillus japonicus CBS 114.51]